MNRLLQEVGVKGGRTQGAFSWDWAHASVTVSKLGRDGESSLLANAHIEEIVIPSVKPISFNSPIRFPINLPLDDLAISNHKA